MITAITVSLYIIGWLLFVMGQAHNSVKSSSNGLMGLAGFVVWLRLQAMNLVTRAFFSAIFYPWFIAQATNKLNVAGLHATAYSAAGIAGYTACAGLYQVFGLIPWLRVEVGEVIPPEVATPFVDIIKQHIMSTPDIKP
jgi:hypothetical protein